MRGKALIVGIDGLPEDLLHSLMARRVMAGLKTILDAGHRIHPMNASLPDISSVSWASFMTGRNPAEHGIYGFTQLKPGSYALHFTSSRDIKAPAFWETLSRTRQVRSLVLNVPTTYPAVPIDGLLVSGFVAPDFERAVQPPSYIPLLREMGYVIDVDAEKARQDKAALYADLIESVRIRTNTAIALFDREPWDLVFLCITETDRLHHFFFDQRDSRVFDDLYRLVDACISQLYDAATRAWGRDFLFLALSDHGFARQETEVNLNAFLRQSGMLTLDCSRQYYDQVAAGTTAFAMDPGRIYVHTEDRFPRGRVSRDQLQATITILKDLLLDLKDPAGRPVIRRVFDRDAIYRGPFVDLAPDLVCVPFPGFDLKGNLGRNEVFTKGIFTGMHTWDNAVLIAPDSIAIPDDVNVEYPTGIITDYYGIGAH